MSDDPADFTDIPFVEDGSPIVIDYNRPIVEVPWVPPPPKQPEPELPHWRECNREALKRFNYMLAHFEEMFESETTIKDFYVNPLTEQCFSYEDEHNIIHGAEIQKQLIPWIRKELSENRLFNDNYWKPFPDYLCRDYMYLCYRKMFIFNDSYFQLVLNSTDEIIAKFELVHYDEVSCSPDNMMADNYWNRIY